MYRRLHHQLIDRLLKAFDAQILIETECFFGGGTAIALMLDEYRESLDVDFLCASPDGYRRLRNSVKQGRLDPLLKTPLHHVRDARTDQYGIRAHLLIDDVPIKVEIVWEARIELQGGLDPIFPVPSLSRNDMFAEKLLANTDRALDQAVLSRDIIDIAMMARHWGDIPTVAIEKALSIYGDSVLEMLEAAFRLIEDRRYFHKCLTTLSIDTSLAPEILTIVAGQLKLLKTPNRKLIS